MKTPPPTTPKTASELVNLMVKGLRDLQIQSHLNSLPIKRS
jgi:hypothetical protein